MSKMGGVVVVILSLISGFGGGYGYNAMVGGSAATTSTTKSTTATSTAETQSLEDCLKEVWGDDKYAALTANSSLATTEDNFSALKCYQAK
jgi:hypothetical protein